jgi:hypothetical protein
VDFFGDMVFALISSLMFIPFDNDPYPLGKGGGYMGSNYPKSAWPADGGIDSHPFAGFEVYASSFC